MTLKAAVCILSWVHIILIQGLLQDAINEFQVISKINTDAALPHEILGSLYSEVGDKDKAIDELQKALTLTK